MNERSEDTEIIEVCIWIENARTHLYYDLLRLFYEPPRVWLLWWSLYEEGHWYTAALTFIKREMELEPGVSKLGSLDLDQDRLYRLLRLVERYERRARGGRITLDDAFKMAARLETFGVDDLYSQILRAVDPKIGKMATRSMKPVWHGWMDLAETIEACSTNVVLLEKVRRIMSVA